MKDIRIYFRAEEEMYRLLKEMAEETYEGCVSQAVRHIVRNHFAGRKEGGQHD